MCEESVSLLEKATSALELARKESEVLRLKLKEEKKKNNKEEETKKTKAPARGERERRRTATPLPETPPFARQFWSYRNDERRRLAAEERTHPLRFPDEDEDEEEDEEDDFYSDEDEDEEHDEDTFTEVESESHSSSSSSSSSSSEEEEKEEKKLPTRLHQRHHVLLHRRTARPIRRSQLALGSFRTTSEALIYRRETGDIEHYYRYYHYH